MIGQRTFRHLIFALLIGSACTKQPVQPSDENMRTSVRMSLLDFEEYWLYPAKIAPPTISFSPKTVKKNGWVATIEPVLAEQQPWNQWPGDGYRLFNNRAAHLFYVTIDGTGPIQWKSDETKIRINYPEKSLDSAQTADELLAPLRKAAVSEQEWILDTQFGKRHRGAGSFRAAYLPSDPRTHQIRGLIAFPVVETSQHVVVIEVDLSVQTAKGKQTFTWLFD